VSGAPDARSRHRSAIRPAPSTPSIIGVGLGMFGATTVALTSVLARLAYRTGENAFTLSALRIGFAAVVLSAWAAARARHRPPGMLVRRAVYPAAIGATCFAGQSLFLFEALSRMPASMVVLAIYTYPSMALLIGVAFRRDHLTALKVAAVGTSFAGVSLVLATGLPGVTAAGVAFAVGCALFLALFVVLTGHHIHAMSSLDYMAIVLVGATASMFAVGTTTGSLGLRLSTPAWGWSALFGVILAAGAMAYGAAIRMIGPSRAAIADTFGPVAALILTAVAFSERPTALQLVGGAMVVAAVALIVSDRGAERAQGPLTAGR
jgi:drug/metabolite transporter (DMT)-like permease